MPREGCRPGALFGGSVGGRVLSFRVGWRGEALSERPMGSRCTWCSPPSVQRGSSRPQNPSARNASRALDNNRGRDLCLARRFGAAPQPHRAHASRSTAELTARKEGRAQGPTRRPPQASRAINLIPAPTAALKAGGSAGVSTRLVAARFHLAKSLLPSRSNLYFNSRLCLDSVRLSFMN